MMRLTSAFWGKLGCE